MDRFPSEPTDQPSVTVKKNPLSPPNDPTEERMASVLLERDLLRKYNSLRD